MGRKKTKVVSNRGVSTVSVVKKAVKEVEKPVEPVIKVKDVALPELLVHEDPLLELAQKFDSLHDFKANQALDKLNKKPVEVTEERVKTFRMNPVLEHKLLTVAHYEQGTMNYQLLTGLNELDKEKIIGQLDVLYRVLVKLGFKTMDIHLSFKSVQSVRIEDHLDWLCLNVPYERMPIGYFDKYYVDQDQAGQITFLTHENTPIRKSEVVPVEESPAAGMDELKPRANKEDVTASEMKNKILEAARQCYEEEDINGRYVKLRMKVDELQRLLPSEKKGKKKVQSTLSPSETIKLRSEIKNQKEVLAQIETDWEFNAEKANEMYLAETRKREEREKEERVKESKAAKEAAAKETLAREAEAAATPNDETYLEDDDGMFGCMLDEEVTSTPVVTQEWIRMDLHIPDSWKGQRPKQLLREYCTRQSLKPVFTTKAIGSRMCRSEVTINNIPYTSPEGWVTSTKPEAEELVALHALFQLDPHLRLKFILPPIYRELWNEWTTKKFHSEENVRMGAEKERLAFLQDLMKDATRKSETHEPVSTIRPVIQTNRITQNSKTFKSVQQRFISRLNTETYLSMKEKRQSLPISQYREEILQKLNHNQVLIVSGETGCGKSTQVPQFLAEHLLRHATKPGSVICTQPRRISAMSIANRVSVEMGDKPSSTGSREAMVGYQIRMESKMSDENVLLFCTTGILLRRLESDSQLEGIDYVIVDEVHERTIDSDFLLIFLKRLISIRKDLKVILMSATMEASRFSQYFDHCPVLEVPGRTFPVDVNFLEDVVEETGYVLEEDSPFAVHKKKQKKEEGTIQVTGRGGNSRGVYYEIYEEDDDDNDPYDPNAGTEKEGSVESVGRKYSASTCKMVKRMNDKKVNYELMIQLLEHITQSPSDTTPKEGAILIFLPGMNEIRKLFDLISSHSKLGQSKKFLIIALHSTLSSGDQEKAFDIPPPGIRKIVLSTNIAETGVTIPDVTIVIDTGMAKVISYDENKRVTRLIQKYVAKANAHQRRGRAGRVQRGKCFHLYTREKYEYMPDYEVPEILRLPLEELCLRIKVCGLGSIRKVLENAVDAPTPKMIQNAILTLQEVQALDSEESLTALGAHLAQLPVNVHIGKMILFGAIFKCLDSILTIAAALSYKSPFIRPFGKEDEADAARAMFNYGHSDFLTIYNAYSIWREEFNQVKNTPGWSRKMYRFCKSHYLSQGNLEMIEDLKKQYFDLLVSIGFVKAPKKSGINYDVKRTIKLCDIPDEYNVYANSPPVINAALTAGLYPKIAEFCKSSKMIQNKNMTMKIHPSSALYKEKKYDHDFLVYNTVVMSNNSFEDTVSIWEASSIDPVVVILFATDIDVHYNQRRMILDKWIHFDCFARTAVLLKFLRQQIVSELRRNNQIY
ncbi:P-loop containing nucleoside triphosphate hydrolase protein [Pilobolus umbonatus]|nr:P-loop containing nucleoside triphosphate hydrolase protein [Pilobolus umbonatus]